MPRATRRNNPSSTGGESLAYMIHHFLIQRLVIPIPNAWLIGVAIVLGQGMVLFYVLPVLWRKQHV